MSCYCFPFQTKLSPSPSLLLPLMLTAPAIVRLFQHFPVRKHYPKWSSKCIEVLHYACDGLNFWLFDFDDFVTIISVWNKLRSEAWQTHTLSCDVIYSLTHTDNFGLNIFWRGYHNWLGNYEFGSCFFFFKLCCVITTMV